MIILSKICSNLFTTMSWGITALIPSQIQVFAFSFFYKLSLLVFPQNSDCRWSKAFYNFTESCLWETLDIQSCENPYEDRCPYSMGIGACNHQSVHDVAKIQSRWRLPFVLFALLLWEAPLRTILIASFTWSTMANSANEVSGLPVGIWCTFLVLISAHANTFCPREVDPLPYHMYKWNVFYFILHIE